VVLVINSISYQIDREMKREREMNEKRQREITYTEGERKEER
jgi:hypothetical protein